MIAYSVVIATFERPQPLANTLASLAEQTHSPTAVCIVDSSNDSQSRDVVESFTNRLPITYERAIEPSAAMQRNQGALRAQTPLIGFLDDDTSLTPTTFEQLCKVFDEDADERIGGVAARISNMQHKPPRGLLWLYYRLQAGYSHPTYGGKLFGPAINCLPSYTESNAHLIPSDWLNSTCVLYRTPIFQREKFPHFEGYSFMEDVHLSARIGKTHQLFFHADARFEHHDAPSSFKRDVKLLAQMRIRNQRLVAHDILNLSGPILELKLFLHRLFSSVSILRKRDRGRWQELIGTWT